MRSSAKSSTEGSDAGEALDSYWWRSIPESKDELAAPQGRVVRELAGPQGRVVRELERLAEAANHSLDDLRHKLLTYKAGDLWFPAGGVPKEGMDIPQVITILLLGLAGAGKTSLVNLMYCVLGRAGFVPFCAPADKEGRTICLEEHNVLRSMRNGFCVFDSPWSSVDLMTDGLEEISVWLQNGVRHRQPCRGVCDTPAGSLAAKRFALRRVNVTIVVANLHALYQSLLSGDSRPLQATSDLFHCARTKTNSTENPILVLTHGDKLRPEERIAARVKVCAYLSVPVSGAYDISCLNEHGAAVDEVDPTTSYAVGEAVLRAVMVADQSHRPKTRVKDWLALVLAWVMCALAAFFGFLSSCCSKLGTGSANYKSRKQQC